MNNRFHRMLIEEIGKNPHFSETDFKIMSQNNKVNVEYRFTNLETEFVMLLPTEKVEKNISNKEQFVYLFRGSLMPGRYVKKESFTAIGEGNLMDYFGNWLGYLEEELIGYATMQRLKSHEETLRKLEEQISEYLNVNANNSEYISREEFENIGTKLDEIYTEFNAKFSEIEKSKVDAKKELEEIRKEIEQLKLSAKYLSKRQWASKFFLTVGDWITNPEKIRKIKTGGMIIDNVFVAMGLPKTNIPSLIPENIE